jgi:hypothetical protein
MDQAGHYPLPQMTGTALFTQVLALMTVYFLDEQDKKKAKTLEVLNRMITDLDELNKSKMINAHQNY